MNKYDKLQYPIFMQCREYTLDEYWQDVFGSCAQGKFPKGMRMENSSTLCIYNGKNAKDLFSLPREENEVFKFMMDKFKSRGMRSDLETDNEMRDIQSSKSITEVLNDVNIWKEIKSKKIKEALILDYVHRVKKLFDFSAIQSQKLLATINIGFTTKNLTSDDVTLEDGKVKNIRGLKITKDDFFLTPQKNIRPERPQDPNKPTLWLEKYIKETQKKLVTDDS